MEKIQTQDTGLETLLLQKGFTHNELNLLYVGSYLVDFDKKTFTDMAVSCYKKIKNTELKTILNKYKNKDKQ